MSLNPIRERVLGDDGKFIDKHHVRKLGNTEEIERLKGEIVKLKKANRGKDEHWEGLRSTDLNKAVDQANAKAREVREVRRDMDRLEHAHSLVKADWEKELEAKDAEIDVLRGTVEQLKKEVSSIAAQSTTKKVTKKK